MSPTPSHSRFINRLLAGNTDVRPGEGRAALAAGLLMFLLLTVIMILRPLREALGLSRGIEHVRLLFLSTLGATILLAPIFGWLVSRVPRRMLLAVAFRVCGLILVGFSLVLTFFPATARGAAADIYYVFHSVFNLFVVSLFWAFMADLFDVTESKRLFPAIAVGGSLGAIFGSLISAEVTALVGVGSLFLFAAVLLELSVWVAALVAGIRPGLPNGSNVARPIGGHPLAGVTAVFRSSYILGIAMFVVLIGVATTFLYFTGLRLVAAATPTVEHRAELFASINIWIQVATLLAQAIVTSRIMRVAGVATALAVFPCVAAGGFAILAVLPTLTVFTLVSAALRAVEVGITRPARETLFTVIHREEKYKAKPLIDTCFYRAGDVTGAQFERWLLASLGPGLLWVALAGLPITVVWVALSIYLGRAQARLSASGS